MFVGRTIWRVIAPLLAFAVLVAVVSAYTSRKRIEEYRERRRVLQTELDSARAYLGYVEDSLEGKPGLSLSEVEHFRDRGLEDPVADIEASLREMKNLIPYEGVMGGTMDFSDVHVLTSKWALAYFEDGHVGGSMLLEYEVSPDGEISWDVIRTTLY